MRRHPRSISRLQSWVWILFGFLQSLIALPAAAVPTKGFREDWPGTSLQGWSGGSEYANPGAGGVDGAADGFLAVSTLVPYHLGTVNLGDPYPGNWIAAGIQLIKVSLNDIGTDDPLTIHFSFADGYATWQYNPGFLPPHNQWQEFTVDLTRVGDFTRILGTGFVEALSSVDRIHFRHDLPPYIHPPDLIQGDVGFDRLIITNPSTAVPATTWGRIKSLYR